VQAIFDNRTGKMWDKGYVRCPDLLSQGLKENPQTGMDIIRLREVGRTFRHESR
jgi:hypothetical protein